MSMHGETQEQRRLGFAFRMLRGVGRLALEDQRFFGWLKVEHLELDVPNLKLPLNLAEGPELFQRSRTSVRLATLSLDQTSIDRFVTMGLPDMAKHGVAELQISCCDGYIAVAARVREGNHVADLTCRVYFCGDERRLRALIADARVCGYLPTPAALLAHRLLVNVLNADKQTGNGAPAPAHAAVINGLGDASMAPLAGLLWRTMPAAGWRLPATRGVRLVAVRVSRSGIHLNYGPAEPGTADTCRSAPRTTDLLRAFNRVRTADELLAAGDHDGALRTYRAELSANGFEQPLVLSRLLALTSTKPSYFVDGIELARQVLGGWPDFAAAHAALATIAVFQGDTREAASRFRQLAAADGEESDLATSRAALASARILRVIAPSESTPLYEQVVSQERGHAEAAEALSELYANEERWHDLERLIRERIAATADSTRQARDRVRLANVLWHHIGDAKSAREQLETACELDPDNVAAMETLADLHLGQQDGTLAIRAVDNAIRAMDARGDVEGEARLHARVGAIWEELGDENSASARYQRAMELVPELGSAVSGAARVAERKGSYEAAATLWKQLIEAGGHPTVVNAEYTCELARCLLGSGDTETAIPMLERVAELGRPSTVAEAHTLLADVYIAQGDPERASEELGTAITALLPAIGDYTENAEKPNMELAVRAAKLALRRARLIAEQGSQRTADKNYEQAYQLARNNDVETTREAARALLDAAGRRDDDAATHRWIEAILDAAPETEERVELLLARAQLAANSERRDDALADVEAAISAAPGDEQHAVALGLKAWILGAAGDSTGRARSLAERAALSRGDLDTIAAESAAAEAWLGTDDRKAALEAAQRAVALLDQLGDDQNSVRQRALAALGEAAWRGRVWNQVVNAYRPMFALKDIGDAIEARSMAIYSHRLGIALDKTGEKLAALSALKRTTQSDGCPGDVRAGAWKLLSDIFLQLNKPLDAAAALESFAADEDAEATDAARADAWYRAGDTYRKQRDHAEDAERCLDSALRLTQDHLPALDALERIKREAADYERVAVIIGRKIAATAKHPNRQKALLARLAELQLNQLDRTDVARATFSRALEIDPDYRPALKFIAVDAHKHDELDSARKAFARLATELPGDADLPDDAASLAYERIAAVISLAALVPADDADGRRHALALARKLAEAAADHPELAATIERLGAEEPAPVAEEPAEPSEDIDRSVVELARNYHRSGRRSRAIAVLKAARDDGLLSGEGVHLLGELQGNDGLDDERASDDAGRSPDGTKDKAPGGIPTAEKLRAEAAAALESGETLVAADLLVESVDARARALAIRGQTLDTGLAGTLEELREIAETHGHHVAYAEALLTASAVEQDKRKSADLLQRASQVHVTHLEDPAGAADALSRALALTPADKELVAALIALHTSTGDNAAMLDVYELHLQALSGAERAFPLFELGRLHHDVNEDVDNAASYFAKAHKADPKLQEVWIPLGNYRMSRGELDKARTLYRLALDKQDLSEQDRATLEEYVGELEAALASLSEKAMEEFLSAASRVEDELRLGNELERSGQIDAATAHYEAVAAAAPQDRRPLECLVPLYKAKGDVDALTELLGRMIVITSDNKEKAELWFRRAKLYRDELHREPETYRCLKEAHANDPENANIAHSLRSIAMARGEWALAAELIYRELDVVANQAAESETADTNREAGALHLELALIYDEKLLDADQALRNYEQALALDDEIPAAPKPLARLYELAGRHAEAAHMGELAAERIRNDDERGQVLKHAAVSAERAGEPEMAKRLYNLAAMAISDDSDARDAQDALARLSDDGSEPTSRSELLQLRLLESEGTAEQVPLLREMLELVTAERDLPAMRKHAQALLEADHSDLSAYLTLKAQAENVKDWDSLAQVISVRAAAIKDPAERAALFNRLGRICQNELRDPNRAIGAYKQALAAAPDHPGALEQLADIAYRKHDWNNAQKLYARLKPQSSAMPEDALAFRRAEIAEVLGRDQDALEAFIEATKANSSNRKAFKGVARCAIRVADTQTAIKATRSLLDLLPRDEVKAITAARLRLAQMSHHAGDAPTAIEYYEMVLAEDSRSLPTLRAITALYKEGEQYTAATKTLHSLIGLAQTPGQRAELLYDLGELYRGKLGDPDLAADAYLKAIDLDPAHVPTLRRLIDYYWRIDEPEALLEIANDLSQQAALIHDDTDPESLARTMVVAATLGSLELAQDIGAWMAEETAGYLADALIEGCARSVETTFEQLAGAAKLLSDHLSYLHYGQIIVLVEGEVSDDAGKALVEALRAAS